MTYAIGIYRVVTIAFLYLIAVVALNPHLTDTDRLGFRLISIALMIVGILSAVWSVK